MIKNTAHFESIEYYIKQQLAKAKVSVKICVAWINFIKYKALLNRLCLEGVEIEIFFNDDYSNNKNLDQLDKGIKFSAISNKGSALMHNKFCIIDNKVVITGSFNWSISASLHFENIVIIENDYELVKRYLHEFEDIRNFFLTDRNFGRILCLHDDVRPCRSYSFYLGILGNESGLYNSSLVAIWNVCFKNKHVTFVKDSFENHLQSALGLKDEFYDDNSDHRYDKEQMLIEFKEERQTIERVQNYFKDRHDIKIHALGFVGMDNHNEHIEYGEDANYVIHVLWRDMFFRKIIPEKIENGEIDIDEIINRHDFE